MSICESEYCLYVNHFNSVSLKTDNQAHVFSNLQKHQVLLNKASLKIIFYPLNNKVTLYCGTIITANEIISIISSLYPKSTLLTLY